MPKITLYNQEGKSVGEIQLTDSVFGVDSKSAVLHQVYEALMANAREPWAHTKGKGDVRGGGKKPWKQKGTGRARHGSIRSPIWRGGGVTFGPLKDRNYEQKINKKMNKLAVKMCLSDKIKDEKFVIVDNITTEGKTKEIAQMRKVLPGNGKTALVIGLKNNDLLKRATRNIPKTDLKNVDELNLIDLMHHKFVILTQETVSQLEKRLA